MAKFFFKNVFLAFFTALLITVLMRYFFHFIQYL
jgi:hypothetical protein